MSSKMLVLNSEPNIYSNQH